MTHPKISAAIICYNEEALIGQCLDVLDWCDEIIVVDSDSTDRTVEIVNRHRKACLFHRPFDNFINQKNHALQHCNHGWVLSVDADEILTAPLIKEIQHLDFDVAGYRIGRRSFLGSQEIKHGNWSPDYQLRLFKKSCSKWGGSNPHETILLDGPIRNLKTRMLHYSYQDRQEYIDRNRRYVHMMVEHLTGKGHTANFAAPALHWFGNFMKAYFLRAGFLDGSAGLFLAYRSANGSFLKHWMLAQRTMKPYRITSPGFRAK